MKCGDKRRRSGGIYEHRLAWLGVWLTAWLLALAMVQPVNLALGTELPAGSSVPEPVSVVETVADPVDCSKGATRLNISFPTGSAADPFIIESFDDLQCMQQLVNKGVQKPYGNLYRNGYYWQFSSFDASGATLGPIGNSAATAFSGTITAEGGAATISNLRIEGDDGTGLFGRTSSSFSLGGIHLTNFEVTAKGGDKGTNYLGSFVGFNSSGSATITNCSVSGTVSGVTSAVGGLVGSSSGGPVVLDQVSFTGAIIAQSEIGEARSKGDNIGGLVGYVYGGDLTIKNAVFDGKVVGKIMVGGLVGYAMNGNVDISKVSVRATIISQTGTAGGLIGLLSNSSQSGSPKLTIDNAFVVGSISDGSDSSLAAKEFAGLVGTVYSGGYDANISSVISAVDLFGVGKDIAGLIHTVSSITMTLSSVLNLARFASSSSDGYAASAALVLSDNGQVAPFYSTHAYYWQGLSASSETYHPFTSGTISGADTSTWKFNGDAINCSNFSDLNFWTGSDSMSLSANSGWNFNNITSGYLPSLNGKFTNQPFSCMNEIIYPSSLGISQVSVGFGSASTLPIVDTTDSVVHYFLPNATMSQTSPKVAYRFETSGTSFFDIFYKGNLVNCAFNNTDVWLLPTEGLLQDATISLREGTNPCVVPNFSFTLTVEGTHLLLKWTAENTQSVTVSFPQLVNNAGGIPPVINAKNLNYSGTATAFTHTLGEPMMGTYTISASGSILGQGETLFRPVAETFTWMLLLPTKTQLSAIYFPDVFVSNVPGTTIYKTITYKTNDGVSASQVGSVNATRYAAIRWLASVAVTEGSQFTTAEQSTYRAQDAVNRGAMAQFLQKLAGFTDGQISNAYAGKTTTFTDIGSLESNNPARYYAILWLADTKITEGCNTPKTQFCPGNVVNRGAMAEFMRKFAGVAITEAQTSPFPDVFTGTGTYKNLTYDTKKTERVVGLSPARVGAINWLASTKITLGSGSINGKTTFRAQDAVNRGAMAEFMLKLALHVGSTT